MERLRAVVGRPRVVAIERPVARRDRLLLVAHRRGHVDAVGDAGAVGDDQRGAAVRLRLAEGLERLERIGAHGHGGHVDVAVVDGHHAQVLLAHGLAAGGELGHGRPRGRLRRLAAGVRVDLGIEHQDVDVAARGQDVVEAAEADVVGPAVAADDPDAPPDQGVGHAQEQLRIGGPDRASFCLRMPTRPRWASISASSTCSRLEDRPDQVVAERGRHPPEQLAGVGLVLIDGQPQAQAELGVVLEQRVAPGRALAVLVLGIRGGGQVAAVDRRAAGGVGDHRPVAEELAHQLQIGRLAAAGARARELEERLEELRALDHVELDLLAVDLGDLEEEVEVGPLPSRWSSFGSMLMALCLTISLLRAGQTSTQTPQPVQSSGATWTVSC